MRDEGIIPPFQFHYGSVKRLLNICNQPIYRDFNSTMVRLKDLYALRVASEKGISIPLWFG